MATRMEDKHPKQMLFPPPTPLPQPTLLLIPP